MAMKRQHLSSQIKSPYVVAVFVAVCLSQCYGAAVNTYLSSNGKSYYNTPLFCDSGVLVSPYLKFLRQSYTARDDKDCCYLTDSRNSCCFSDTECRCSTSVTCGLPTTTSTSTTTTTTPTTTTTSTTTTPTTTTTSTTTTTPTTTPTTPTTVTTTTTTTPVPTTVQPRMISLCQVSKRVLNGAKVTNSCSYPGIANITISNFTICHAVLTTATVNGTYKTTFLTAGVCKKTLTATTQSFDLEIGIQRYPIPSLIFRLSDGPNDSAFIEVNDRYTALLSNLGACQAPACPYNNATMSGKVDFNNCKVVSYGNTNTSGFAFQGEMEVPVKYTPTGCTKLAAVSNTANSMCFTSNSGLGVYCLGDSGAPVYCQAPSNGEWILVGVTQVAPQSCGTSPEFRVIPYPG